MICAVVGHGSIGKRHVENLQHLGVSARDIHIVDPLDGPTTLGEVLALHPQVVLVCTPADTHYRIAKAILSHQGGEVPSLFLEKPLCKNLKEAQGLLKLVDSRVARVGYCWRVHPGITRLKNFIAKKERSGCADIVSARLWCFSCKDEWPGRSTTYGDAVSECSHEIDLAHYLFGATKLVSGARHTKLSATIRLANPLTGCRVQVDVGYVREKADERRGVSHRWNDGEVNVRNWESGSPHVESMYRLEMQEFLAEHRNPRTAGSRLASISDAAKVMEAIDHVRRSKHPDLRSRRSRVVR